MKHDCSFFNIENNLYNPIVFNNVISIEYSINKSYSIQSYTIKIT